MIRAIDEYIGHLRGHDRNEALRQMLSKHGREPCKVIELGRQVLPHRHPRSVYNYVRRRIVKYNTGKWTEEELYVLLEHYFSGRMDPQQSQSEHSAIESSSWTEDPEADSISLHASSLDAASTPKSQYEYKTRHSWRAVSAQINRLPEQVYDKWKEIRPTVENYRELFETKGLSKKETIRMLGDISTSRKVARFPAIASQSNTGDVTLESDENSQPRPALTDEERRDIHAYIVEITANIAKGEPLVSNIPWKAVSEHFHDFSESKIRLQWSLNIYPDVLRRNITGFSDIIVARCGLHFLRKRRLEAERLSHFDFGQFLPQLPPLYVVRCVDMALKKCVRTFAKGKLQVAKVAVSDKSILSYKECNTLLQFLRKNKSMITAEEVYALSYDAPAAESSESQEVLAISDRDTPSDSPSRPKGELAVASILPYNVVKFKDGFVYLSLFRQIKLAYCELKVKEHFSSDMEILKRIPQDAFPPYETLSIGD